MRPDYCPTEHYALMLRCWSHEPEDRPKFAAIISELTSIKPTQMKAIRPSTHAPGVLDFAEGDMITVVDKKYGLKFCFLCGLRVCQDFVLVKTCQRNIGVTWQVFTTRNFTVNIMGHCWQFVRILLLFEITY